MQLLITKTPDTASIDGVLCRRWAGAGTEQEPISFDVWVHRIQPRDDASAIFASACLAAVDPPGRVDPRTFELNPEQIEAFVKHWIAEAAEFNFPHPTLSAAYLLVRKAHLDGADAFAMSLIMLMGCWVGGLLGGAGSALSSVLEAGPAPGLTAT